MAEAVAYEYLSCAVNRTPHVSDWVRLCGSDGAETDAVVFGVHNSFAMWLDPCSPSTQLRRLWPTQSAQAVHVLKVIQTADAPPSLVLGTYQGAWELWHWEPRAGAELGDWVCDACVTGAHAAPVTALGVMRDATSLAATDEALFVTGGSDATLQVWGRTEHAAFAPQTLSLRGAYPLDVALVRLPVPEPVVLMAVALTDRRLWLYTREGHGPFVQQLALEGHEDWIRALDAVVAPDPVRAGAPCVLLASASQDQHIRLWKLQPDAPRPDAPRGDAFEALASEILPDDTGLQTQSHALPLQQGRWAIALDALLLGHDAWVTGVRWHPHGARAALVSSSVDNSVIVWMPQSSSAWPSLADPAAAHAMWLPMHRLGDVGSLSGGFLGALWRPGPAPAVLAHDRQGAWHLWSLHEQWAPQPAVSGHAGAATSVAWAPHGDGFLTTGADRTVRLHGTYATGTGRTWHELARPQTHGYAMQAAAWLDRTSFVSAADEKVLRVFSAPQAFIDRGVAGGLWQTPSLDTTAVLVDVREAQWHASAAFRPAVQRAVAMRTPRVAFLLCAASLEDARGIEACLQTLYTTAWACATAQDDWDMDVRVYLVPGASSSAEAHRVLRSWSAAHAPLRAVLTISGPWEADASAVAALAAGMAPERVDPAPTDAPPQHHEPAVRGRVAAVGGTFDHLHIGHKLLLSMAALCATHELVVGVTSPSMLTKKQHAEYVEPLHVRQAAVREFVRDFCATMRPLALGVVPLHDACGPAGTCADVHVLVLTDETAKGGELVAQMRAERGLPPVAPYVVRLVDAQGHAEASAASKLGSTAIRARLAAQGVAPGSERVVPLPRTERAAAAHVPPLGLSNRAVDELAAAPVPSASSVPGPEELQALTLWPEVEKLYGHAYELLWVAVDPHTRLVASTCKATTPAHAVVRLFDGADHYCPLAPLDGHTLSITRVAFSPDGAHLLTVSRDRSWRIYKRTAQGYVPWIGERAHARIVWDGAWAPSDAEQLFATASRDKSVKVWRLTHGERPYELLATLALPDAAMSVAWHDTRTLAVGLESGDVRVYRSADAMAWAPHAALPRHHTGAVLHVAFRPMGAWIHAFNEVPAQLLSAGDDGCVRLVSVSLSGHTLCE
ncbi:Elongator subunit elp2 [Malassezia caprae]|uniref:Elongator complex protein 2 n=1 Tax=Malassezia caprae TaxID=1381934 RepID=A0AAF0ECV1_9BASI|nr:Elongator subunit elp2 [Malassezia caprae]